MNQQIWSHQEPAQLFRYLPKHQVAICTTCRHAVPPRAVDRHLKEIHGMRRSLRSKHVKYVDSLDLCEPADVVLPSLEAFPISELPVLWGLQCSFADCGHLCLTEKRMRRHWKSAQHRIVEPGGKWCSVPLQTFFSGNLLKYFSGPALLTEQPAAELTALSKTASVKYRAVNAVVSSNFVVSSHRNRIDSTIEGLLRHYHASTATTITTDICDEVLWRHIVTRIAVEHEFSLLAILALTSLHMAYLCPDHRGELAMQANAYQDEAMLLFRKALDRPTAENCHAIVVFHHLLILYTFATELRDDNLLLTTAVGEEVVPRWLYFIRSACVILLDVIELVEQGPCRKLAMTWQTPIEINRTYEALTLELLLALVPPTSSERSWTRDIIELYNNAASHLALAFASSKSSPNKFTTWDALRIWPARISVEFITLLQSEHPGALILLAHYTTLLKRIGNVWYFQGRADGLLRTISSTLDPYWYSYIPPVLTLDGDPPYLYQT